MQVVGVPYPGLDPEKLSDADLVLATLEGAGPADLGVGGPPRRP
jgi:hypothetical protein